MTQDADDRTAVMDGDDSDAPARLGDIKRWVIRDTNDDHDYAFEGRLLGRASSHRAKHDHATGRQCHACRWIVVYIIKRVPLTQAEVDSPQQNYVVVYVGHSTVDGETRRTTVHETASPYAVIEALTQQRGGDTFLPRTARLAISEAAARDKGIELAWIERS